MNREHRAGISQPLGGRRRVTRRGFLYIAGAASSAALLAACTGQPTPTPTAAPPAPTPVPATAPPPIGQIEKDLFLYNWAEYVSPANVAAFSKQFGVKVTEDTYPSNEDLLAQVKAGSKQYDLAAPTGYMVRTMAEEGLLLPLDYSRLPNAKYISPPFDKRRPHDPNNKWSVTKDWGTFGIMWNSEKVKDEFNSWDDLWKLAPKYSGQILAADSSPEVLGAALKYLGYSYNAVDPREIDAALNKLLELKPHLRGFDSAYIPAMAKEEVLITMGWNGDAFAANAQRQDAGKAESLQYVIPREGSEFWEDDWVILKSAPHPNAAYAFINFILDPRAQAEETNFTHYASGEDEAKKYISPEILRNPAIYPPPEVIFKLEAPIDLPPAALKYREAAWAKLKRA